MFVWNKNKRNCGSGPELIAYNIIVKYSKSVIWDFKNLYFAVTDRMTDGLSRANLRPAIAVGNVGKTGANIETRNIWICLICF